MSSASSEGSDARVGESKNSNSSSLRKVFDLGGAVPYADQHLLVRSTDCLIQEEAFVVQLPVLRTAVRRVASIWLEEAFSLE